MEGIRIWSCMRKSNKKMGIFSSMNQKIVPSIPPSKKQKRSPIPKDGPAGSETPTRQEPPWTHPGPTFKSTKNDYHPLIHLPYIHHYIQIIDNGGDKAKPSSVWGYRYHEVVTRGKSRQIVVFVQWKNPQYLSQRLLEDHGWRNTFRHFACDKWSDCKLQSGVRIHEESLPSSWGGPKNRKGIRLRMENYQNRRKMHNLSAIKGNSPPTKDQRKRGSKHQAYLLCGLSHQTLHLNYSVLQISQGHSLAKQSLKNSIFTYQRPHSFHQRQIDSGARSRLQEIREVRHDLCVCLGSERTEGIFE